MSLLKNRKYLAIAVGVILVLVFLLRGGEDIDVSNTIRIANGADPGSLDPNHQSVDLESRLTDDLMLSLITLDKEDKLIPGMAERWEISNNGKTYIFYLRDSKWSDGVPVSAHDFEYSLKRILNPETAAKYASFAYIVQGAESYNTGEGSAEDVRVRAIDDKTLRIDLNHSASYFLEMLTHQVFYPIPKHVVEKHGNDWTRTENFVSNGPYKLVDRKLQTYLKFTKNEHFYDAENVAIENVIYYTQPDEVANFNKFRKGQLDLVYGFPTDRYDWLQENMKENTKVFSQNAIYYYVINVDSEAQPALKDKRVRQAISMLINREFITNQITKTGQIPAYSFVPKGMDGYNVSEYAWKPLTQEQRVAKAKELLSEAGYGESNPITLEIKYNTLDGHRRIAVAIADMLKQGGIEVSLYNQEVNVHYDDLASGNFEMGRAGWVGDYLSPLTFLSLGETGDGNNYANYSNARYDNLLNQARASAVKSVEYNYYRQAESILLDDSSYVPLYYYVSSRLVADRLEGFAPNLKAKHLVRWMSLKEE